MTRLYAHPPRTRGAAVDLSSPWPARFLAGQVTQSLRHGLPARHAIGGLKAAVARQRLPEATLAGALGRVRRRRRTELDDLLAEVLAAWPNLAARCGTLPPEPPASASLLAVSRSAALTAFVFDDSIVPLVVLKIPADGDDRVDREVNALRSAEPAGVTPRSLGRVGAARVQQGLAGVPLSIEPLTPADAAKLPRNDQLSALAEALAAISLTTQVDAHPTEVDDELFDTAAAVSDLDDRTRRALGRVRSRLAAIDTAVLKHSDTSPHNVLFDGQRLTGIIDWEMANPRGAPAFDILTAAVSYLEHGVGQRRWTEDLVIRSFRGAWHESPCFEAARQTAHASATQLGLDDADYEALEIAFFARRLGRRVTEPHRFATAPAAAARMLEIVCVR